VFETIQTSTRDVIWWILKMWERNKSSNSVSGKEFRDCQRRCLEKESQKALKDRESIYGGDK
jgi:hypothetical protein